MDSTTENPRVIGTTEKHAREELKQYLGMGPRIRESPYSKTQLAQIRKIERDADSNLTGYATVEILTMPKNTVRVSALMPIPSSQYWFVGGLPPINTLCTVGWLPQGICIILAYYPMIYRKLVELKGLPDLALGEVLIRCELTEGGVQRAGAQIYLDRDGAVRIRDKDGRTTITMEADGTVTVDADVQVTVNSAKVVVNSEDVNLGGESGQELVTRDFLDEVFATHTHAGVQSGASTTGPPSSSGTDKHTTKTKAE